MNEELKHKLLTSIALTGTSNPDKNVIIASKEQAKSLLTFSSGLPTFTVANRRKFSLILSQPLSLKPLNALSIRCCLCGNVISYPAWYYSVKYAVNQLHYFVCFDGNNAKHVTARCFKR